jgi:hypothetical protein
VLRTRTAAIWWLLVTAAGRVQEEFAGEKEFEEDQELLLDAGMQIMPNQQQTESEQNELLNRVLRVFIQYDLENTLKSQHTVRDYLLVDKSREAISEILKDPDVKLGNAFVSAIVAKNTLRDIMVDSNSRLAHLNVHQRVCMLTFVLSGLLAGGIACVITSVCASNKFCVFELTNQFHLWQMRTSGSAIFDRLGISFLLPVSF